MLDARLSLTGRLRQRLGAQLHLALAFAAGGGFAASLTQLPVWIDAAHTLHAGALALEIARDVGAVLVAALVLMFALRLATDTGAELLRRPARFIVLLTAGATLATLFAFMARACFKGDMPLPIMAPPGRLLYVWLQVMLWGALVGWLYLLSLQRVSDQAALGALLCRHALLERQLSGTRLAVARGRVDPAMVAQVLAAVHARHAHAPEQAAALLDELIRYLRLAMNRGQPGAAEAGAARQAIQTQLEEAHAVH